MIKAARSLIVFAAIAFPLALGCLSSPDATEATQDDQASVAAPVDRATPEASQDDQAGVVAPVDRAPPEVIVDPSCAPPRNGRCGPGCCPLFRTNPPSETCLSCF